MLDNYHEFLLANTVFWALAEGFASEFSARRTAMENATKNADEMVKKLTLTYNRSRQAVITNELWYVVFLVLLPPSPPLSHISCLFLSLAISLLVLALWSRFFLNNIHSLQHLFMLFVVAALADAGKHLSFFSPRPLVFPPSATHDS